MRLRRLLEQSALREFTGGEGLENSLMPASAPAHRAWRKGSLPATEEVAEGIWAVPVPYSVGRIAFTFAYLVEDERGNVHVIDPGWDSEANYRLFAEALSVVKGRRELESIFVTHLHSDHLGLAQRLRAQHDTPIYLHHKDQQAQTDYVRWANDEQFIVADLDAWAVPSEVYGEIVTPALATPRRLIPADHDLKVGELLPIPGRRVRALHTPGHTPGHLCLHDEDNDLLFTGDHLLPQMSPGIGVAGPFIDNPLRQYLESLAKVRAYDHCQSLPGHEYRYRGIAARATVLAARHFKRMAEVEDVLAKEPHLTVWQMASRLNWARGWSSLSRHNLVAALRQTAMHAELIRGGDHHEVFELWG